MAIVAEVFDILIVDDDRQLASMLAELLATEGYHTTIANDGIEAIDAMRSQLPDLVVLDVMMPRKDGIDTLDDIRRRWQTPVIMLTAMGDEQDRILGLQTGADDYLAKPFAPRELLLRIAAILRRTSAAAVPTGQEIEAGRLKVSARRQLAELGNVVLPVTAAELRILEQLAASPGEVVSRQTLTLYALGREWSPLDRALDTHISHLRRKLEAAGGAAVEIRSVRGNGYQLLVN